MTFTPGGGGVKSHSGEGGEKKFRVCEHVRSFLRTQEKLPPPPRKFPRSAPGRRIDLLGKIFVLVEKYLELLNI